MDLVSDYEWCFYTPDKSYEGLESNAQDTFYGAKGHDLTHYPFDHSPFDHDQYLASYPDDTQRTVSYHTPHIMSAQPEDGPDDYTHHHSSATAAQELAPGKSEVASMRGHIDIDGGTEIQIKEVSVSQQDLENST